MSNKTTFQEKNERLNANNTNLTEILNTINNLPEAGGGTGKYAPRYIRFMGYPGTELGYELSNLDASNITSCISMFESCSLITTLNLSFLKKVNITSINSMFKNCSKLTSLDFRGLNLSNVTYMAQVFYYCTSLTDLNFENVDFSKITGMSSLFYNCIKLTNLTFGNNLGQDYTSYANNSSCNLELKDSVLLTHESLMDVINKIYDLKSAKKNQQKLVLGSTNLEKLTADEIAIATNKGWAVS